MSEIMVSVLCTAYNHEKYIRDALEGFVMQKTTFPFEVLIHDDASTDHTAEIIREYEAKYPEIIKPIYQSENQYSQEIPIIRTFLIPRAKGKYIALCEGDDYWTDPRKLEKQVKAMEQNPELDICAHRAEVVDAKTKKTIRTFAPTKANTVFTVEDVILGGGGFVATNSLLYRKEIEISAPTFRKTYPLDYSMQINGALRGGMLYLNDCMSVYRRMVEGSWTNRMQKDHGKAVASYQYVIQLLRQLDMDTNNRYKETIEKRIRREELECLRYQKKYSEMRSKRYRNVHRDYRGKERIKLLLKENFPSFFPVREMRND